MKARQGRGFTLIELLIVVAIIAILAAIAVPNFLEAQCRAKVSRVKNDMRSISVAWEAYHVDWNTYPRDQDNDIRSTTQNGLKQVTTPVAYMTSLPMDPFFSNWGLLTTSDLYAPYYEIASAQAILEPYDCYCIMGVGTDHDDDFSSNDAWPDGGSLMVYDPTNGTVSNGDIYRFGGQYLTGSWTYCGRAWQQWGSIAN